jgi:myo-inositol 2-dehydrogenase/D-chiro-inositol 1-dehydrogenase
MIKVGIIGTGIMGAGHARFIKAHVPDAKVVALADIDAKRVADLAAKLGTVELQTDDPEKLMNDPNVDAVIIVSPDPLHVAHLRLGIKSGKHILCEKPIATTIEDARAIAQEIRDYEKKVGKKMINFGFMRRFDPGYREVRRLIATGEYGAPLFVRAICRNTDSGNITSSGLFTNIAIHDFDIYRWLFNSEWESVQGIYPNRSSDSPEGVADPLIIIGKLKNGVTLVEDVFAFARYGYDTQVEVVCEKAALRIGIHGDVAISANFEAGVNKGGKMDTNWMKKFEPSYIAELQAWAEEIKTGVPNPDFATVEDALIANESAALGVTSVSK